MNNREFKLSAITNNATYNDYMYRARKIATSRFKWKNLPDTWDDDFLENTLYDFGVAGCMWDVNYGNMITQINFSDDFNIYDLPTKVTCFNNSYYPENNTKYVYNGFNSNKGEKECVVLIRNNPKMIATIKSVDLFCRRLYEIERTMDVNVKQQKTPSLLLCSQHQRLTILNLYKQYDGNQPFIFADKNLMGENNFIRSISTDAPFLLDKLNAHKHSVWCELLSFLGINNVNFEKKERLITDEANANNHFINLNIYPEYNCRKKACKQINDYFGLNIDVEINTENVLNTGGEKIE